jgi:hypothetical protein
MREALGAVPSNFTMPFNEAGASAGPAQLGDTRPDRDHAKTTNAGMNAYFNFIKSLLSGLSNLRGTSLQSLAASGRRATLAVHCGDEFALLTFGLDFHV